MVPKPLAGTKGFNLHKNGHTAFDIVVFNLRNKRINTFAAPYFSAISEKVRIKSKPLSAHGFL